MRAAVLLTFLALPAAAQDAPGYDPRILTACLDGHAGDRADSCIGIGSGVCMATEGGSSTMGMVACLGQEFDQWDGLLNAAYQAVLAEDEAADTELKELGSSAPASAPALREMQRNWIAYRDAACSYEASRWQGGTGGGPASVSCAMVLTARQAIWLRNYVETEH